MGTGNFLAEMKRRHVYRAGGAYAVAAFGLIEIVSNVAPMFDLPGWVGRALVLVLIVGFPLTLFTAWMIESKPAEGAQTPSISKLDYVLAGALVLVAGLLAYQQVSSARDTALLQKTAATATPAEGVSIAVLPFVNLSGDPTQEFFSDGMTEEITSALANVKGLRVVGRTSAFEFKGQNKDLRAIGQALGTTNLLEGSVRKVGNRVRITGQLIRAADGSHIWTENYDRELTDIFATQDDIARAIAGALQVPLGLKMGETFVASRNISPENHQQYLRAKAIYRARLKVEALHQAIGITEQVVARDPSYAPAWALLAQLYAGVPSYSRGQGTAEEYRQRVATYLTKADMAGRRAIELDSQNADSYVGFAFARHLRGEYVEAEDRFKHALNLDAFNPDLLHYYSETLLYTGRIKEAVAVRQQLMALEPIVPIFNDITGRVFVAAGQYEAALALYKALPIDQGDRPGGLLETNILLGRGGDAADVILSYSTLTKPDVAAVAVRLLRMPPTAVAPKDLPVLEGTGLTTVYYYVGAQDRYFQFRLANIERDIDASYHYPGLLLWGPHYAPVRKTERFKALMRKAGLVDYWRARAWPDMCRPVGADDFECS